jgi:CDP-diacylglycerol--glycerol-3-phosphate 3-phosphatidyltransferase
VPYVLWYFLLAATMGYFAICCKDRREYWQFVLTSGTGLTLFLVFSFIYPNGLDIRPTLTDGNIFVQAVKLLYRIDTPTNVLPSMHVFMSIACAAALCKNERFASSKRKVMSIKILAVLICLSTVMLKQHSVIDVMFGIVLYAICYQVYYRIMPDNEQFFSRFFHRKEIFTIPNVLSFMRIVMAVMFLGIYNRYGGMTGNRAILTGIVILSGITDFLDGKIARRFNMVSEVGKILDPFADKVTQGVLLLCLFRQYSMAIPVFMLFIVKEGHMLIVGSDALITTGVNDGAKWYGKISTAVFYTVMIALVLVPEIPKNIGNLMILICGTFMLLAFVNYAKYYHALQDKYARNKSDIMIHAKN